MKVFVTGAEGFVGKRLVDRLWQEGCETMAVDMTAAPGTSTVVADIRSRAIRDLVPQGADAIIHLAGISKPSECDNNAYTCFDANVMATLNLIEAAQEKKVKQFIFASSEWVYGDWKDASLVKDEESVLDPGALTSEYAFSKYVSEVNLRQKYQYGFCPVTILRFGIIYGPSHKNASAMETLFRDVTTKEEIQVGSLKTGRCFIHVEDIVSGIKCSFGLDGFNIINLQGDKFISLKDIIEVSKKISGKNPLVRETSSDRCNLRNVANAKAAKLLGFRPRFGLEEGLMTLMPSLKETVLK